MVDGTVHRVVVADEMDDPDLPDNVTDLMIR